MDFKILNISGDTADLMIYEHIASYTEAGGQSISKQLAELEGKASKLRVFINSPGGSVPEGIAIFNLLSRSKMAVSIYVDGVAASMAAIITQVPGTKCYMSKYAKMMLHSVSGMAFGSSSKMREVADMMDDFQGSLEDIVSDRTGMDKEAVKAAYFDGKDHWLNAQQALDAKLIDGIVDGKLNVQPPKTEDPHTLHNYFNQQILNSNTHNIMLEKLMNLLGLSGEVTEQQAVDQVQAVMTERDNALAQITALQGQVEAFNKAKIDELISNAVTAGKITAEMKPTYEKLAQNDFDSAKAIIDSIAPYKPISGQLGNGETGIPEDRKNWSFTDWQKKDGKGLLKLKAEQPELYNEYYKNQFGNEPKSE